MLEATEFYLIEHQLMWCWCYFHCIMLHLVMVLALSSLLILPVAYIETFSVFEAGCFWQLLLQNTAQVFMLNQLTSALLKFSKYKTCALIISFLISDQISLVMTSVYLVWSAVSSRESNDGLPPVNQHLSWIILGNLFNLWILKTISKQC